MESLVRVAVGDEDLAVGISGFGSARVGTHRWKEMADLTGRTTYYLQYDAQEFPWSDEIPLSLDAYYQTMERWKRARSGAEVAATYLSRWLTRWTHAGRRVLVVGFSLGGFIAWSAVKRVPEESRGRIDLVLLSAALGDRPEQWRGLEKVGTVVNGFSTYDMALRYLYPHAVSPRETPAAGICPICPELPNVENVDLTDLIGRDHLWGSENVPHLVRIALGHVWNHYGGLGLRVVSTRGAVSSDEKALSADSLQRLYRWTVADSELWGILGRALDGDVEAVSIMRELDAWSLRQGRFTSLLDAGSMVTALDKSRFSVGPASRGRSVVRGLLRFWIRSSPELESLRRD